MICSKADKIVKRGMRIAGAKDGSQLEKARARIRVSVKSDISRKALDAPLEALFHQQLRTLSVCYSAHLSTWNAWSTLSRMFKARAADRYEASMAAKPNPVEATLRKPYKRCVWNLCGSGKEALCNAA